LIAIEDVLVSYQLNEKRINALEHFDLKVDKGAICAMIGPSGCGKSTLLKVIAGLNDDYTGKVLVNGSVPNPKKDRIGFVPQQYGLLDWATAYENAVLGLKIKGDSLATEKEHISSMLGELGLTKLLKKYPLQLSGGEQQRVAIARAFLLKPQILLMDEPFSALDAINREKMQSLFLSLWKKHEVTTVFVTHSVEEAICIGQKIAIMTPSPGRIARVVDNPLFGREDLMVCKEYYDLAVELRRMAGEIW
jgi:NitT/TauT family transport system ATP-binding protein